MRFPIRAVVFDWAGTMVDFGCQASLRALVEVFAAEGVALSEETVRRDLGRAKLDHLRALIADRRVALNWAAVHGAAPVEADVERLYAALTPAMIAAAAETTRLIPGAAATVATLRDLGVRIGSGADCTREMMAAVLPRAAEQGYSPEVVVCADETPTGRPAPLMTWKALVELDAWPAKACVKVDDTPVGVEEGRSAGCWTVGVSASGAGVGLSREALEALSRTEQRERIARAETALVAAGADFVIEDVSELLPVIHQIAARMVPA